MRIILNTGKGGVGKTTISALTGLNIAKRYKTLVISSDLAHSLSDAFDIRLNDNPSFIADNLYALEIDAIKESKKAWGNLNSYIKELIKDKAISDIQLDELLLLPGLDDVFSLLKILEIYEQGDFEVLIIDCGPSAETLSLLSTGEKFNNLADALVPLVKRFNKLFGGFIEKKTEVKKPKDIVFDEFISLSKKLYALEKILKDKSITSVRIISKANRVIMNESFRTYSLMNMYGFLTDGVFINMIYPESIKDSSYRLLYEEQKDNMEVINEFFTKQKIFPINLFDTEITGLDQLRKVHDLIFRDVKLEEFFTDYSTYQLVEDRGTRIVIIDLAYAKDEDVKVLRIDDDLEISYLNFKRRFSLPENLRSRKISSVDFIDGKLKISMDYD